MSSQRHRRKRKYEEYEFADLASNLTTGGGPSTAQTSYDLLGQACGVPGATLRAAAQILRLRPSCQVYNDILAYVQNSMDTYKITVQRIYKIERKDERDPFDEPFRLLLWHGTQSTTIPLILQNGFRRGTLGPHNWFGSGLYLADRIAMSCGFARSGLGGSKFLILAEVAPGKIYKAHNLHTEYQSAPPGYDTVKGMGSSIPNWKQNRSYYGAIMPCGASTLNTRHPSFNLPYNEYIVYDMDRIIARFIVECTF